MKMGSFSSMFRGIGLCVGLKILFFFQANGVVGFGGLIIIIFLKGYLDLK
jgi:hypothetical protein